MPSKNPDDWVTPQLVTRFVSEKLWKKFPYPPTCGCRIVWEYGILEKIVDVALHPSDASKQSQKLCKAYEEKEREATLWILSEAVEYGNKLAADRRALLLMVLGVANAPIPQNLSRDGALEEHAARIYEVPQEEFRRSFERARSTLKKWVSEMESTANQRLLQIRRPSSITKKYPNVASKFPKIFERLDKRFEEKHKNQL